MELFNKFQNVYYEVFTKIVNDSEKISSIEQLRKKIKYYLNDMDVDVEPFFLDYILDNVKTETYVYTLSENDDEIELGVDSKLPIVINNIETDALKNLLKLEIAKYFLSEETIDKLKAKIDIDDVEWSIEDIKKKRQFKHGDSENIKLVVDNIKKILEAMRELCPIRCDNSTNSNSKYKNQILYPIKIEYSPINDKYRLFCIKLDDGFKKYIKMNISSMENVEVLIDNRVDDMDDFVKQNDEEFLEFQSENCKEIVLHVDPEDHVLDRCFRLFSFYDREAEYDSKNDVYILKIGCYIFDEAEIIKNILSLGNRVVVAEPQDIRKKIIERVKKSVFNYCI